MSKLLYKIDGPERHSTTLVFLLCVMNDIQRRLCSFLKSIGHLYSLENSYIIYQITQIISRAMPGWHIGDAT